MQTATSKDSLRFVDSFAAVNDKALSVARLVCGTVKSLCG